MGLARLHGCDQRRVVAFDLVGVGRGALETVDDEFLASAQSFIKRAHSAGKPFFVWLNPTRMHVVTHLSPKYEALRNSENEWTIQEAGMAQFDDVIGAVMAHIEKLGETDNTIIGVTTDNGTENFTWPDGGTTPFKGWKGMGTEGGFRVPCIVRWPAKIKPNQVINGVMSGMDWLPTFLAAAGDPDILATRFGAEVHEQLKAGNGAEAFDRWRLANAELIDQAAGKPG